MVNDNPSNWRQHGYPQPGYAFSGQYQAQPPRPAAPSTPQSPQTPAPSAGGQPTGYDPFVNWRNAISQAQQNAAVAAGYPQPQPTSSSAREAAMPPQNQQSYAYWQASTVPPPRQAQPISTPYTAAAQQSSAPIGQPPFYPGPWPPASRAAGMMAVSRSDSDSRRVVHLTQGGSLTGYGVPQGGPSQGGAGAGSGATGQTASGGGYAAGTGSGQAQGGSSAAGHYSRKGWRS